MEKLLILLATIRYFSGKLIYLIITRPDIVFAVSLVSQQMHAPTVQHLEMVKHILQYLKGSIGLGIVMNNNGHTNIMCVQMINCHMCLPKFYCLLSFTSYSASLDPLIF